jgi:hypothetical protein
MCVRYFVGGVIIVVACDVLDLKIGKETLILNFFEDVYDFLVLFDVSMILPKA